MKTTIILILFVMSIFSFLPIWFMVEMFMESGTREFEPIITVIRPYINTILFDCEPKGNRLIWDCQTKTMYGCPVTEMEDKT